MHECISCANLSETTGWMKLVIFDVESYNLCDGNGRVSKIQSITLIIWLGASLYGHIGLIDDTN